MSKKINASKQLITEINNAIYKKSYNLAFNLINEYKNIYGEDSYVLLSEGRLYRLLDKYDEDIKILEPIIELNSKNIGYILYELATAYKMKKEFEKALELYLMVENTTHKDKEYAYYEIASLYYRLGNYNEAEKYFKKVIYNGARNAEKSKIYLAKIETYRENYNEAEKWLDSVMYKKDKTLVEEVLYNKARILSAIEKYEETEELLLKIINSYNKNYTAAYIELIYVYCKKNQLEEATRYYDKIKDTFVYNGHTGFIIAEYKLKIGLLDEAMNLYNELLNNSHNDEYNDKILLNMSHILISKKQYGDAKEYLKKIKYSKHYNDALKNLMCIEMYEKNFSKAYEYFLSIDNNIEYEKESIERIKLMLLKNLNIPTVCPVEKSYTKKQIINYDKNLAITHIKEHAIPTQEENISYFNENVNIEKLYNEVKQFLIPENLIELSTMVKYRIKYPNIGINNGKIVDELIVVTKLYNDEIITMYPESAYIEEKEEQPEEIKNIKVKRLSQIEKFNKKYNRTK